MGKKILLATGWVIGIVLVIDFIGFASWVALGQHPYDEFYVGTITTHFLQALTTHD